MRLQRRIKLQNLIFNFCSFVACAGTRREKGEREERKDMGEKVGGWRQ